MVSPRGTGKAFHVEDALVTLDRQQRVAFLNDSAAHLMNTTVPRLLGQSLSEASTRFTHPVEDMLAESVRRDDWASKVEHIDHLGMPVELRALAHPDGAVLTARDPCRSCRSQAELLRENNELRNNLESAVEASQSRAEFVVRLGHEARTPLNAIIGFAELLASDLHEKPDEQQARYLGFIRQGGEHLLKLLEDTTDLASIDAGRLTITPEVIDLDQMVQETTSIVRQAVATRDIGITAHCDDDARTITCDRTRLRQIVNNLLTNAVKYSKKDGGFIAVTVRSENADTIKLSILDDGIGIPEDCLETIFEPFKRLEPTPPGTRGNGIGLTLTKHLVEQMGGVVRVRSRDGVGSEFTVCLPRDVTTSELGSPGS